MTSGRSVLIALLIALVIFVLTHFAPIPGSLADLTSVSGGHTILDQQPAFTTPAVYDRLDAFGEEGRRLYQRFLLTTDIVFPLGLLTFLFLFARFSAARFVSTPALQVLLPIIPLVWFGLDMVENLSIAVEDGKGDVGGRPFRPDRVERQLKNFPSQVRGSRGSENCP